MLTKIGKPPAAGDAVELLVECHERIRSFLALARRVADPQGADREEVRQAAGRVSRYFTLALPLHAEDEEQSILPRLRGRDPALDAELEAMRREHAEHLRPLGELVRACDALALAPERQPELAGTIGTAAEELTRHFAEHLRREEEVIFPAIRRYVDPGADAEVVREIRARRGAGDAPGAASRNPLVVFLAAEHVMLDALLEGALAKAGELDLRVYDDFREALLRHIAAEEKVLFPAVLEARGGEPLPEAERLRVEHGALAILLAAAPTRELALEIRKILVPHDTLEEDGGVYETCEALLADRAEEILRRIRQLPGVNVARYLDGPRVCRTAHEALRLSAMQSERGR
jgi:iron-sulfur cluster repair protein YtfE (RIC family)